jgi:hypothetical protein
MSANRPSQQGKVLVSEIERFPAEGKRELGITASYAAAPLAEPDRDSVTFWTDGLSPLPDEAAMKAIFQFVYSGKELKRDGIRGEVIHDFFSVRDPRKIGLGAHTLTWLVGVIPKKSQDEAQKTQEEPESGMPTSIIQVNVSRNRLLRPGLSPEEASVQLAEETDQISVRANLAAQYLLQNLGPGVTIEPKRQAAA